MSSLTLLVLGALLVAAAVAVPADKPYTTKYDNVDVKQIVQNKRLLLSYVHCIMDKGPCTPDGEELKKHIPDALETGCSKCSEKQKGGTEIMFKHLIVEEPELYKEMETKFDPKGIYRKKYEEEAKKHGIKL